MSVKYSRASRRARWNKRIREASDPVEELKLIGDYARAAAKGAPVHVVRRALGAEMDALHRAARNLDTALEREEAR